MPPEPLLLVDDDPLLLDTLRDLLTAEGFQVATAATAEEAEAALLGARPPFGLVITDLVMPGRSGMDVLHAALRLNPGCTVLVLSGFGTLREATEAMDRGAYGLVNKPLQLDAFRHTLRRILERTQIIRERDALKARLQELEARVGHLEALQGRMEMLAQHMTPRPPEAAPQELGGLQDLAALHQRGLLTREQFEAAKRSLLAKWLT
jgi:DNA-binding NtrC family response regulator